MRRARAELARADVALLVTDAAHAQADRALLSDLPPGCAVLTVCNKIDLNGVAARRDQTAEGRDLYLSGAHRRGLDLLRAG